ncbi:MAG: phosphate ABC transporter permease PstA [Hyphomicrobiaceae bacterium]|nr:phosphate ABC transporter permease PstA [Hyphomicrobiaceae bacterium]
MTSDTHTSDEARRRLRARYASETRFRYIGLGAVLLAGAFLVILMSTIVTQGLPAFTAHFVTLELDLSEPDLVAKFPDEGDANGAVAFRREFDPLLRGALREELPFVTGRGERRTLNGLLSSGAGIYASGEVLENRDLMGAVRAISVPLDDDAELYLQGSATGRRVSETRGIASPTGTEGEIEILSTSNDFATVLAQIKEWLLEEADDLREDIAGKRRAIAQTETQLAAARREIETATGARLAFFQNQVETMTNGLERLRLDIGRLEEEATELEARAARPGATESLNRSLPSLLVEINGGVVRASVVAAHAIEGTVVVPLTSTEDAPAGTWRLVELTTPEAARRIDDTAIIYLDQLSARGLIDDRLNMIFLTTGASREPELAGIWGAVIGSFFTMMVTLLLAFPLGVAAAIYLEEFAPKNRLTRIIEVNINNLAAVPSIVFGLLGLAVFLNAFGLPRSAPVVGGMVLALMTLPTIIIAARAAVRAVPPSIREAALGLGASRLQTTFHHVLPLAMPGIFTGTIIGMAQALGETAPLLMIGMVAFIVDIPGGPTDAATVLPVQVYMWSDFPEALFRQKTAAAILVLLSFLVAMNAIAVLLRKRFERRW